MLTKLLELNVGEINLEVKEDTQFVVDVSKALSKKSGNVSLTLIFNKSGVTAEIICMYSLGVNESVALTTSTIHKVPNTSCVTYVKGVLFDGSESDYIGKIIIEKKAQQTNSYLNDDILVVGENTKNNSQPILEIEADDVKASHGATTGRVSKDQLYYLESRGLSEAESQNLIVEGFFESLLSKICDVEIKNNIRSRIINA